jgi:hypothetical protein
MVGMAIAAAKLNPMVRILSTPGVYIVTHIGLNALFVGLNAGGVLKNEGPNIGNIVHSVVSIIVICLLLFMPILYGGFKVIKKDKPILFWLLIAHILVNIIYIILLFVIPEEEAKKTIATIYSSASCFVCIGIAISGNLKNAAKTENLAAEAGETPTENPVAETKVEETKTEEVKVAETKKPPEVVAFGKRQRRRNPPKRRRRKKKY